MALFKVKEVINGNTIRVDGWKWGDAYSGKLVVIQGYSLPSDSAYKDYAQTKLKTLLDGKSVELRNVIKADKSEETDSDTIYCSVFLDDVNIATYFGELNATNKK